MVDTGEEEQEDEHPKKKAHDARITTECISRWPWKIQMTQVAASAGDLGKTSSIFHNSVHDARMMGDLEGLFASNRVE